MVPIIGVLALHTSTHYPLYAFDLRATHARTLLPAALASVSFGFVLVRVRVRAMEVMVMVAVQNGIGPLQLFPWSFEHVRLVSFIVLICAALLLSLPVSRLISAPWGLTHK